MTERLHFDFSLSCIGEGNGNPLQYSGLENPMDGEAWWAAVHGVTRSWTRLSDFTSTFHFHALKEAMAPHSSVLAWWILWTEEPGGLPSMGSHRVGHDWSNLAAAAAANIYGSCMSPWERGWWPDDMRLVKLVVIKNSSGVCPLLRSKGHLRLKCYWKRVSDKWQPMNYSGLCRQSKTEHECFKCPFSVFQS